MSNKFDLVALREKLSESGRNSCLLLFPDSRAPSPCCSKTTTLEILLTDTSVQFGH